MRLILGAHCTDGVVLISEGKITDLATRDLLRYDGKVFGVLRQFGYEGAEVIFRVFLRYVLVT